MTAGVFNLPEPANEPVRDYPPGSPERAALKARLDEMAGRKIEIPMVIGGREVRTGRTATVVMPHDHEHVLAEFHRGGEAEVAQAIEAAAAAREEWSRDALGGAGGRVPARGRAAGRARGATR